MIALIDGDIVAFRCATSMPEDGTEGLLRYRIDEMMDTILTEVNADAFKVFLTGTLNFRYKIYPEYKAHRPKEKPKWVLEAKEYLTQVFNAETAEGQEADDLLGINQTKDSIICSIDKDLLQVPGKHYNFVRKEFYRITEYESHYNFYKQCLTGDRTDNIKGIDGIGDKKAQKILQGLETELEMFNAVREAYSFDNEFLINARGLWIRRKPNEDWKDRFEWLVKQNEDFISESEGTEITTDSQGQLTEDVPRTNE